MKHIHNQTVETILMVKTDIFVSVLEGLVRTPPNTSDRWFLCVASSAQKMGSYIHTWGIGVLLDRICRGQATDDDL